MSNNYPGNSDGTVKRRGRNGQGHYETLDLPLPSAIKAYNRFMGGVDVSDQLISYHRVLRRTKKYWKTLLFHLLEISVTNAAVLKKWLCMQANTKPPSVGKFRDALVQAIIHKYAVGESQPVFTGDFTVRHGSTPIDNRRRCAICKNKCSRKCPDCPFSPALCQSARRDCHGIWHATPFTAEQSKWFCQQREKFKSGRVSSLGLNNVGDH